MFIGITDCVVSKHAYVCTYIYIYIYMYIMPERLNRPIYSYEDDKCTKAEENKMLGGHTIHYRSACGSLSFYLNQVPARIPTHTTRPVS